MLPVPMIHLLLAVVLSPAIAPPPESPRKLSVEELRAAAVHHEIVQLTDGTGIERFKAAMNLRDMGPDATEAVPALLETARSPDDRLRSQSLFALSEIAPQNLEVRAAVCQALSDTTEEVRGMVIGCAVNLGFR